MFAPVFHSAMKHALGARKEIGIRTIFNLLGPLTNPASAKAQVMGVYDGNLVEPIGRVLANLGVQRALVVHGVGGLDEVSTFGLTRVCEVNNSRTFAYTIDPQEAGISRASVSDLAGGDARANAAIVTDILRGKRGPRRDIVVLNSACGIYVGGAARSIKEAIEVAEASIDSGRAHEKLNEYVRYTGGT
jgi:anthranilate phosphoribosyltransferase